METLAETRQQIEKQMDELARQYKETHDPEIIAKIKELGRRLSELAPE